MAKTQTLDEQLAALMAQAAELKAKIEAEKAERVNAFFGAFEKACEKMGVAPADAIPMIRSKYAPATGAGRPTAEESARQESAAMDYLKANPASMPLTTVTSREVCSKINVSVAALYRAQAKIQAEAKAQKPA